MEKGEKAQIGAIVINCDKCVQMAGCTALPVLEYKGRYGKIRC